MSNELLTILYKIIYKNRVRHDIVADAGSPVFTLLFIVSWSQNVMHFSPRVPPDLQVFDTLDTLFDS
jgi:hypothetical protein